MDIRQKESLIEAAKLFYQKLDFWHGPVHGERVVRDALQLQQIEGGDRDLVEVGAWLHQFHDHLDELRNLLAQSGLSVAEQESLFHIVEVCRPTKINSQASLEAQIVFDADALQLMGAYGIVREVLCNVQNRNLKIEDALLQSKQVQELFEAKLQTKAALALSDSSSAVASAFWRDLEFSNSLSPERQ